LVQRPPDDAGRQPSHGRPPARPAEQGQWLLRRQRLHADTAAIYNHARRGARELPADNPTSAVDWNDEKRRDAAMGTLDLPGRIEEAGRLCHAIRREFHLFTLLRHYSRPATAGRARETFLDGLGFD
jgi:hypothetical protein